MTNRLHFAHIQEPPPLPHLVQEKEPLPKKAPVGLFSGLLQEFLVRVSGRLPNKIVIELVW